MSKDQLFLLAPGFNDSGRREYCPECVEVWGVLSYFPAIKESLIIEYQDIEKPRAELLELLGPNNQNCPSLILSSASPIFADCGIQTLKANRFIDNARDIGKYYAQRFGTPFPRG